MICGKWIKKSKIFLDLFSHSRDIAKKLGGGGGGGMVHPALILCQAAQTISICVTFIDLGNVKIIL